MSGASRRPSIGVGRSRPSIGGSSQPIRRRRLIRLPALGRRIRRPTPTAAATQRRRSSSSRRRSICFDCGGRQRSASLAIGATALVSVHSIKWRLEANDAIDTADRRLGAHSSAAGRCKEERGGATRVAAHYTDASAATGGTGAISAIGAAASHWRRSSPRRLFGRPGGCPSAGCTRVDYCPPSTPLHRRPDSRDQCDTRGALRKKVAPLIDGGH